MSPTPPALNPSQTVERIREIIVGRHLERLEGRVSQIENEVLHRAPVESGPDLSIFEDRILASEAKIEALQEHSHRSDGGRQEIEELTENYRLEVQQLTSKIQRITAESADRSATQKVDGLEKRLAAWFPQWQDSVNKRLDQRDQSLVDRIETRLADLNRSVDERLENLESRIPKGIENRFERIAEAARALAESAASISNVSQSVK
ncbi:MAG: hypothetical protein AB8D78_03895 [Akkermansiaceae bacterium]